MRTKELTKLLQQAVQESDEMPLMDEEQRFYTRVRLALMAYEDEVRFACASPERRCMNCGVRVSRCCC